jgi:hypothetical protein
LFLVINDNKNDIKNLTSTNFSPEKKPAAWDEFYSLSNTILHAKTNIA